MRGGGVLLDKANYVAFYILLLGSLRVSRASKMRPSPSCLPYEKYDCGSVFTKGAKGADWGWGGLGRGVCVLALMAIINQA